MDEQFHTIQKTLKKELGKERYEHTLGVMYTAAGLAMRYGCDMRKAMLAGLLHDCAKAIPHEKKLKMCKKNHIALTKAELDNPSLIHAKLGAFLAKSVFDVDDPDILHAIEVHNTGIPGMSLLDKIIFLADYIEPNRFKAKNLPQIRSMAFEDIDTAILLSLRGTLDYLDNHEKSNHIDPITRKTYEYYKQEVNNDKLEGNGKNCL